MKNISRIIDQTFLKKGASEEELKKETKKSLSLKKRKIKKSLADL